MGSNTGGPAKEQRDKQAWREWLQKSEEGPTVHEAMMLADKDLEPKFGSDVFMSQMMRQAFSAGFDAGKGDGLRSSETFVPAPIPLREKARRETT